MRLPRYIVPVKCFTEMVLETGVKMFNRRGYVQKLGHGTMNMQWDTERDCFILKHSNTLSIPISPDRALLIANKSGFEILGLKDSGVSRRVETAVCAEAMQR